MLNFKDITSLHSVLTILYEQLPGPDGQAYFSQWLQSDLHFNPEQAERYSSWVLTKNSQESPDLVKSNASKLKGKWSKGDSGGSAGNLLVTRTESWIFAEDLTYENKNESYEGYNSPFGGGYSRPRSSSSFGIWAPNDLPFSSLSIVTIDDKGLCRSRSVSCAHPEQSTPQGMHFNGGRFGKMY